MNPWLYFYLLCPPPHLPFLLSISLLPYALTTPSYCIFPLQIIAGMTAAAVSFLMSGLLQIYVTSYHGDDCHGGISIAWQLPQLFFISIAEAIVCVTGLEFAYSQAPPQYRSAHHLKPCRSKKWLYFFIGSKCR